MRPKSKPENGHKSLRALVRSLVREPPAPKKKKPQKKAPARG
jgi:hypothetical protein